MKKSKRISRAVLAVILIAAVMSMASCTANIDSAKETLGEKANELGGKVSELGEKIKPKEKKIDGEFEGLSFSIGSEWEKKEYTGLNESKTLGFFYKGDAGKPILMGMQGEEIAPNAVEDFYNDEWETVKYRALQAGYYRSDVLVEDWTNGYVSGKSYILPDLDSSWYREILFYDGGKDNIVFHITYPLLDEDENEKVNKSIEEFIGSVKVTD